MNLSLKKAFLYIFASIGLVLIVIGLVSLINLGLRTFVFTQSDYPCYETFSVVPPEKAIDSDLTEEERRAQTERDIKNCEQNRISEKQRSASNAIAMLIVGIPLYMYHWSKVRKDNLEA